MCLVRGRDRVRLGLKGACVWLGVGTGLGLGSKVRLGSGLGLGLGLGFTVARGRAELVEDERVRGGRLVKDARVDGRCEEVVRRRDRVDVAWRWC